MLHSGKELVYICLCLKTFCENEFKGDRLINLAKEISRQPSTEAVSWLLLSFKQVYMENWEQKTGQTDLKSL
jgi:hypothetical protein